MSNYIRFQAIEILDYQKSEFLYEAAIFKVDETEYTIKIFPNGNYSIYNSQNELEANGTSTYEPKCGLFSLKLFLQHVANTHKL